MSKIFQGPLRSPPKSDGATRIFASLPELLAHYAQATPAQEAILAPGLTPISYAALWVWVEGAVRNLRSHGLSSRDRVGVVLPNGPDAAATMLAVAAGAVCVPLNPGFTANECIDYFQALRLRALVMRVDTDWPSRRAAHALAIPVLDMLPHAAGGLGDLSAARAAAKSCRREELQFNRGDAFILLTSGTTARPKLVPLTHASVCLSAYNAGAVLALAADDRLLQVLALFHAHGLISGLLAALAAGSSVVCTSGFDAAAFFDWLGAFRPTWYTAVPAVHRAVLAAARSRRGRQRYSLRLVRSASASLPRDVLEGIESFFGVPLLETYGMTEAASQIAANPLTQRKPGSVGRPAGPEIAILDAEDRPLPAGEQGAIALRGPTLARGYDNDVLATKQAFRRGWFRTGDLGYLDEDGFLFIVGRSTDVINRGGQKVSPAEVEAVLLRYPGVEEAAVFSVPHRGLGEDVAAAVVLSPHSNVSPQKLRNFARQHLATFKVPRQFRLVAEIPKTASGKVNRANLAAVLLPARTRQQGPGQGEGRAPPANPGMPTAKALARAWAKLLDLEHVDVEEDVFALGADSLSAAQMLARLRTRFGVDLSYQDIFDAPTPAALAARLGAAPPASPVPLLAPSPTPTGQKCVPLSLQQQRIYVLMRLDPTGYDTQVLSVARLQGRLDVPALEACLRRLCQRHEVLRSTFAERDGEPAQAVGPHWPRLEHVDLAGCQPRRRAAVIKRHARKLQTLAFDPASEPPLRAKLLRFADDDHALLIRLHHLVTDGWSQRLFWQELGLLYAARVTGRRARLPKLSLQYRHFTQWQRNWLKTAAAREQLAYWHAQLEAITELPLPTDRPRPAAWSGRGARYPLAFSAALSRRIKALSRAHNVSLFMTLLAAFQCLLSRYTRHDDIAVGSLIGCRTQAAIEQLMGIFANTIVLRTDLAGDPSFSELLGRVRRVTLQAYGNQDLPIDEVMRGLKVSRDIDRNALFRVMFILQNAAATAPLLPGLRVSFLPVAPALARADLILELVDAEDHLTGWLEYSSDLFDAKSIARMAAHLKTLLLSIVANPNARISRLPLLSSREQKRLLGEGNASPTALPQLGTLMRRFEAQVYRTPNAIAASMGDVRISYRDLARRSGRLAARLRQAGAGRNDLIAIYADRGLDLLVAILAVQCAGAAFLALDPALAKLRLTELVRHSGVSLLVRAHSATGFLEQALAELPGAARPRLLDLEELGPGPSESSAAADRSEAAALACVLYTSGSTGAPKGVMIEQAGLCNHLLSKISDLELSSADVVAQTAPQSFVIALWQFLTPLLVGARVHVCGDEEVQDPALLMAAIKREGITVLQVVPALLRELLRRATDEAAFRSLGQLRCLISTGEYLGAELVRAWFQRFPGVPLLNAYGLTECSDDVATHRFTAAPGAATRVSIGRPIANARLYVLDAHRQPVPAGVVGELYVGGVPVSRGYLNDPQQTAERFVPDPYASPGGRFLYRTGDLVRRRADDTLEFLGRVDHQIKIRGYRIEPEEIEHALAAHRDVQAAVVVAQHDPGNEPRLIAHIVPADSHRPEVSELVDFLKMRLPAHMLPAGIAFLPHLPRNAHGKVDRAALAENGQIIAKAAGAKLAPRDAVEQDLTRIWQGLLGCPEPGILDNFFDLGGHSLLAGRVLARVAHAMGVQLPIRAVFEAPTIAALAARIRQARAAAGLDPREEMASRLDDRRIPLSVAQQHMLRIERQLPDLPKFNLPFAYALRGPLNTSALADSVVEVVRRHEALRTHFPGVEGEPIGLVVPAADIACALRVEEIADVPAASRKQARALRGRRAELEIEIEAWAAFDLARAPLVRARLLRLGRDEHVLVLIFHHIVVDGWSIGVLFEELATLYSARATGKDAGLVEPAPQFSHFVRWQRQWCETEAGLRQFNYWRAQLRGAAPIFARKAKPAAALLGSPVGREPFAVPSDLAARLGQLSRNCGATVFMALLAGFKALLLARRGCHDLCVATAMANRSRPGTEHLVGPVQNTTLIRTHMRPDLSFVEALGRVREAVLEAHANQDLPFDVLIARLAQDGLDPTALIQAFFVLQNAFRRPFALPGVAAQSFANGLREGQPVLPLDNTCLTLLLQETPAGLAGTCTFKREVLAANTLRQWMVDYRMILARAVLNPTSSLARLVQR